MNAADSFVPLHLNRSTAPADKPGDRAGFVPAQPVSGEAESRARTTHPPSPATHARTSPASVISPRPHAEHGRPVVTLRREGDQVTGIRIECTCGKVIEVDCIY